MGKSQANKKYKDSIFRMVFGEDKKALLSLYNALNETDYDNPEDLEINTLEDSVYLGMKNDVSFIINDELLLYEHQSTVNPNIPLRVLFYISELLQVMTADENRYGKKLIKIPAPRFVVFYNGDENRPEQEEFRLSESFINGKKGDIDIVVLYYNINYGQNKRLMEACSILKEYSIFISKVKKYRGKSKEELKTGIKRSVKECLEEGVLVDFLRKYKAEEIAMNMIFEYDAEKQLALERRDGIEEGIAIGMERGMERGTRMVIEGALRGGSSPEQISLVTKLSIEKILEVQKEMLEEA